MACRWRHRGRPDAPGRLEVPLHVDRSANAAAEQRARAAHARLGLGDGIQSRSSIGAAATPAACAPWVLAGALGAAAAGGVAAGTGADGGVAVARARGRGGAALRAGGTRRGRRRPRAPASGPGPRRRPRRPRRGAGGGRSGARPGRTAGPLGRLLQGADALLQPRHLVAGGDADRAELVFDAEEPLGRLATPDALQQGSDLAAQDRVRLEAFGPLPVTARSRTTAAATRWSSARPALG